MLSSFDRINAPVLNKEELKEISQVLRNNDFYDIIDDNLYKIRLSNNKCIFLENGRCSIYNHRPVDCRLYPFDIIKKDYKYYLILYKLECINNNVIVDDFNCIDKLIDKIKPWIVDYTDDRNYTKMKKLEYRILKEIRN